MGTQRTPQDFAAQYHDAVAEMSHANPWARRFTPPHAASWRVQLKDLMQRTQFLAEGRSLLAAVIIGAWCGLLVYGVGMMDTPSFYYDRDENAYVGRIMLYAVGTFCVAGLALYRWLMQTYRDERAKAQRLLEDSELPLIIADHCYGESIFAYFPKPVVDHGFQRKENLSIAARVKFAARAFPLLIQFWRGVSPDDPENARLRLRSNDIPTLAIQHAICKVLLGD